MKIFYLRKTTTHAQNAHWLHHCRYLLGSLRKAGIIRHAKQYAPVVQRAARLPTPDVGHHWDAMQLNVRLQNTPPKRSN
jgi:hypothetical protein